MVLSLGGTYFDDVFDSLVLQKYRDTDHMIMHRVPSNGLSRNININIHIPVKLFLTNQEMHTLMCVFPGFDTAALHNLQRRFSCGGGSGRGFCNLSAGGGGG